MPPPSPRRSTSAKALWSGADGQPGFIGSHLGVSLTLSATPSPATLWWDDEDGLGVRLSYEDDEIESEEVLRVLFHEAFTVSAIYLSDLFVEDGYIETGRYRINGGSWLGFDAVTLPGTGSNGEHVIVLGVSGTSVNRVEFSAPGKLHGEDHEFALMGFDARPVPEPGSAALLGLGLLIVAIRRS